LQPHPTYTNRLGKTSDEEVFQYLMDTLAKGITTYAYFVNWPKVDGFQAAIEKELHLLNSLVGKDNLESRLDKLIEEYPKVVRAFRCLLAIRHKPTDVMRILTSWKGGKLAYEEFDLTGRPYTAAERKVLVQFAKETGILDLFAKRLVNSLPDYHVGVEVGLDSNGRKNRGGDLMEEVSEELVKAICESRSWSYKPQATAADIKGLWGITVKTDKTSTEWDFAVYNGKSLWLIECNFYNSGGSKLKATAGEYAKRFPFYEDQGFRTLWITDGTGWETAEAPLRDTFGVIRAVINLDMAGRGCLEDLLAS